MSHRVRLLSVSERPNVHPLHVSITPCHAEKIGVNLSDSVQSFIAALSSYVRKHNIFVYVRIENTPAVGQSTPDDENVDCYHGLEVACTKTFLRHYDLQSFCDLRDRDISIDKDENKPLLFLRFIQPLELTRIVIAVKNERVHKWAKSIDFSTDLLVFMSQGPVLARTNDVLLAPYSNIFFKADTLNATYHFDMITFECIPYRQGIVTGNTELIFVVVSDRELFSGAYRLSLTRDEELSSSADESMSTSYTAPKDHILLSRFAHRLTDKTRSLTDEMCQAKYNIVPKKIIWSRILAKNETSWLFDNMYLIGVPKSVMIRRELLDGNLVKVCLTDEMITYDKKHIGLSNLHKKTANWHIAQVKMLKRDFDNTTDVYISPLLNFNLLTDVSYQHLQILFFKKYESHPLGKVKGTPKESEIATATEVQLSLITTPDCNTKAMYRTLLKQYFCKPRVVTEGDVISLNSQDDPEKYQNISEGTKYRTPLVHFRIIHVEPDKSDSVMFYADQTTTLIQVGCVQGYAPGYMATYLSDGEELSYFEKAKLYGLHQYVDRIRDIIEPYLQLSGKSTMMKGGNLLPSVLVCGSSGTGKTSVITFVAKQLHLHVYTVYCQRLCSDTQGATEKKVSNFFASATSYAPCILLLEDVHTLGKDRDGNTDDSRVAKTFATLLTQTSLSSQKYPVIVIATSNSPNKISDDILDCFLHSVTIETPNESERTELISGLTVDLPLASDVDISYISNRTAGFVLGDFQALLSQVGKQALRRITKSFSKLSISEEQDIQSAGILLQQNDFIEALDILQSAHSDSMGTPKIPNVKWQDIGGLSHIKSHILDTIQLPLRYPKLLAAGLKRSGILLYGPPGTGKTLLAKAVATECSLNFLSVKGPELINQYVGQSEENVRDVFNQAREASPCVIFFDELDSLAPNRGGSGDSGGVMDRVVSQLLAEMDGLHRSAEVFVIGATNRPDLLDPALLRPGRFDKLLYLGVSEDRSAQVKILKALTRKFHLDDDVDLGAISELCPLRLTGADLYALCSDAMLNAIKRKINHLQQYESPASGDSTIIVNKADFTAALTDLQPSVSDEELERYRLLRESLSPTVR